MPPVTSFTIVYDADCGLCTRAKDWIRRQVPLVELQFVGLGSAEAQKKFPQLRASELAVVSNTGAVWLGNHAWIVCLWALRDYRRLAFRLTSPLLTLLVREAFVIISKNRFSLSRMLRLRSQREMEQQLRKVHVPRCQPQLDQK